MTIIAILIILFCISSLLLWAVDQCRNNNPAPPRRTPAKRTTNPKPTTPKTIAPKRDENYTYEVVGESNYQPALIKIAGRKEAQSKQVYTTAIIKHEPENQYDKNACAVHISGKKVGYIPKEEAKKICAKHGQGFSQQVKALITGGWKDEHSEGDYGVFLDYQTESSTLATTIQKEMYRFFGLKVPAKLTQPQVAEQEALLKDDPRMRDWRHCWAVIDYLQSRDGREEFEIPKFPASKIRIAFQQMQSSGIKAEDIDSQIDELVEMLQNPPLPKA